MTASERGFFSPEAIVMLPFAILIDLVGIILVCFALDDFFITDIIALFFIGGWSFFRSQVKGKPQEVEMPSFGEQKRAVRQIKKAGKKTTKAAKWAKRLKWLRPLCIVGEIIPYVGWLPLWTVFVYFELKYS